MLMSPHAPSYADYFNISFGDRGQGSLENFLVPQVTFSKDFDSQFIESLCQVATEMEFPAGVLGDQDHDIDHGAIVPLSFVDEKFSDYKLVHIAVSDLPLELHYKLGILIKEVADKGDRKSTRLNSSH